MYEARLRGRPVATSGCHRGAEFPADVHELSLTMGGTWQPIRLLGSGGRDTSPRRMYANVMSGHITVRLGKPACRVPGSSPAPAVTDGQQKTPFLCQKGRFEERKTGFEPATFCMASRCSTS
jgi:hypothetical protein